MSLDSGESLSFVMYMLCGKVCNKLSEYYCEDGLKYDEMIEWLALQGYEFSSGVTRETNYLILGDSPGKTKTAKAEKYNTPQITEEQLTNLLKEN